jgi:hypothetical protein
MRALARYCHFGDYAQVLVLAVPPIRVRPPRRRTQPGFATLANDGGMAELVSASRSLRGLYRRSAAQRRRASLPSLDRAVADRGAGRRSTRRARRAGRSSLRADLRAPRTTGCDGVAASRAQRRQPVISRATCLRPVVVAGRPYKRRRFAPRLLRTDGASRISDCWRMRAGMVPHFLPARQWGRAIGGWTARPPRYTSALLRGYGAPALPHLQCVLDFFGPDVLFGPTCPSDLRCD